MRGAAIVPNLAALRAPSPCGPIPVNAPFLGNLFRAPLETVRADAIRKNEAQPLANAALILCNLNGQVKGAKDSALDTGDLGRLEERETKDGAAPFRQTFAPSGRRGSGCRRRRVRA